MRAIEQNGKFLVVDANMTIVKLSKELNCLQDIYESNWLHNRATNGKLQGEFRVLTDDASSFKQLKHYVTGYLMINGVTEAIPDRYQRAFKNSSRYYEEYKDELSRE